jgi:hypothetical protein
MFRSSRPTITPLGGVRETEVLRPATSPDSPSRISRAIPVVVPGGDRRLEHHEHPGPEVPPDVPQPLDERREVRQEVLLVLKRRLDREGHRVALRDLRRNPRCRRTSPAPTTFPSNSSRPGLLALERRLAAVEHIDLVSGRSGVPLEAVDVFEVRDASAKSAAAGMPT